jgi:hypothetical protein
MARQTNDYFGLGMYAVCRWHKYLLLRFRADVLQEIHLLAWEAETRKCIRFKRGTKIKRYGNGRHIHSKTFVRAVSVRMYHFKKEYC